MTHPSSRKSRYFLSLRSSKRVSWETYHLKKNMAHYSYGNLLLVPVGTNQVRCIHSCFIFGEELGKSFKVVGIRGSWCMLFLRAVENLHLTKVSLTDAPASELFNNRAQDVMKRLLDKHENSSKENSNREPGQETGCIYMIEY
jgi:hypothetical protein